MLETELETAIRLAKSAGELILEHYAAGVVAESKTGADNHSEPVTVADREASRLIVAGLADAFPNDGILSEEETDAVEVRAGRERVWMIDPIDGTQGFINKDGDFGVQIGLTENGESVLGVVLLPFHEELFYATKGSGSHLLKIAEGQNPTRLAASDVAEFSQLGLAVSRNHLSPKMTEIAREFEIKSVVHRGSVGLKVGLIARQEADFYVHLSPRTKFWDTCAPQIILEEAGGVMTDLFGQRIQYNLDDVRNHNGVVASNGTAHDAIISRLAPLLEKFGRLPY